MQKPTPKQVSRFGRATQEDIEEEIRRRAYELYEARGREDGHDLEDWLRAEAEIASRMEEVAAA